MTGPRGDKARFESWRERKMSDPNFREAYERAAIEIDQIDSIMRELDERRDQLGMSKAELASLVGKNPSAVRRLFSSESVNPALGTVAQLAVALGGQVRVEFPDFAPQDSAPRISKQGKKLDLTAPSHAAAC